MFLQLCISTNGQFTNQERKSTRVITSIFLINLWHVGINNESVIEIVNLKMVETKQNAIRKTTKIVVLFYWQKQCFLLTKAKRKNVMLIQTIKMLLLINIFGKPSNLYCQTYTILKRNRRWKDFKWRQKNTEFINLFYKMLLKIWRFQNFVIFIH